MSTCVRDHTGTGNFFLCDRGATGVTRHGAETPEDRGLDLDLTSIPVTQMLGSRLFSDSPWHHQLRSSYTADNQAVDSVGQDVRHVDLDLSAAYRRPGVEIYVAAASGPPFSVTLLLRVSPSLGPFSPSYMEVHPC